MLSYRNLLLILGACTLIGIARECVIGKVKRNEMLVAGHRVDKAPCISAMNKLFGKGLDSIKTCECLIPEFYKLIQGDTTKMQKFEEAGLFTLEGAANDSMIQVFGNCASKNIVDFNYKLPLTGVLKKPMIEKLQKQYASLEGMENIALEPFVKDVFDSMDGRITIKEYLTEDYMQIPWLKQTIIRCALQNTRSRF